MNDHELDQLLNAWEAPRPRKSLRDGLRTRFSGAERPRPARLGKWLLLAAAASATLAIGLAQGGDNPWTLQIDRLYDSLIQTLETWRAANITARVRQSAPKVYVDGQPTAGPDYGPAAKINVRVPGDGVYSIISLPGLAGWVEAGHIHGSVIEFMAGSRQVRIECSKPIVEFDLPIFVRRQP